jgi:hypothetical protein
MPVQLQTTWLTELPATCQYISRLFTQSVTFWDRKRRGKRLLRNQNKELGARHNNDKIDWVEKKFHKSAPMMPISSLASDGGCPE